MSLGTLLEAGSSQHCLLHKIKHLWDQPALPSTEAMYEDDGHLHALLHPLPAYTQDCFLSILGQ